MISAFNQAVILKRLKQAYSTRNPQDASSCQILNAPGMCNGIVNLYYRKVIKHMKQKGCSFSYDIALSARDDLKRIYKKIITGEDALQTRIDQLCFFQLPRAPQPSGSVCSQRKKTQIDDIAKINHDYNLSKYLAKKNKHEIPRGNESLPYIKFYDDIVLSQHFSGCIQPDQLLQILKYYLPRHPNELIRIATPIHVIAMGYHVTDDGQCYITLMDPNYDLDDPLKIIEVHDLEKSLIKLIAQLGKSFYDSLYPGYYKSNPNKRFTLSVKFYNYQQSVSEKSGAEFLMELLTQKSEYEYEKTSTTQRALATDLNGYDSLFISSQTGNIDAVKGLLTQYETAMKPNVHQGIEYPSSPMKMSIQNGHENITREFEKRLVYDL